MSVLDEGFESAGIPLNWIVSPTVSVTAPVNWQKPDNVGGGGVFAAQAGSPDSYLFNSFSSTPTNAAGGISDFLITPLLTIGNGTVLTFFVKADAGQSLGADRLRVLLSTGSAAATAAAASFTTLLLDINPTYSAVPTAGGFPTDWTRMSATVMGLSGGTTGRFAFNYLINDPNTQGDFIGLDSVNVTVVPEPGTLALLVGGLTAFGLRARRRRG